MRYTIKHILNTDADTFWDKIFFDPEFNDKFFKERLRFHVFEVLALDRRPDGSVRRRLECAPPMEIPAIAKKVFGDSVGYYEEGTLDPKTRKFVANVEPKTGADKIQMQVSLWVEPRGEKRIERIADVDSNVKIFGIGKIIEGLIEKNTRDSYEAGAAFTNDWIAKKGL